MKMQKALQQLGKMQARMEKIQEELAEKTVTATAGGGSLLSIRSQCNRRYEGYPKY